MILTGDAITKEVERGTISINPFDPTQINPNSYNYRLGDRVLCVTSNLDSEPHPLDIPIGGLVLRPGMVYLANTREEIGSREFVITLLGRSSLGRLGLFVNITADLGHVGSQGQWTLELTVVQPLRIYARMAIGQVAFWRTVGIRNQYRGRYLRKSGPVACEDPALISYDVQPLEAIR